MSTNLFLNIFTISVTISPLILVLLAFTPLLNKKYAAKWNYLLWVILAVRLIVPFVPELSSPRLVITVPSEMTAPIHTIAADSTTAPLPETNTMDTATETVNAAAPPAAPKTPTLSLMDMIAAFWLIGCLLFLAVHIFSFLHYKRRIMQNGTSAEEPVLQQACKLKEELKIKSPIRILRYQDAGSPMVIGFRKPVLVLPDCDYSEDELFFILKHELVHIKRHDIAIKLLLVLANAVHWFNPFVYILQKEAVVAMELSCDERVIRQTDDTVRKAYTETLFTTFQKSHKRNAVLTTQFYGSKRIMKKRFRNILTAAPRKNGFLLCACAVCITLLLETLVGCSTVKTSLSENAQTQSVSTGTTNRDVEDVADTLQGSEPITDTQTASADELNYETIAYLKKVENGSVSFDRAEWVEVPSDRAAELGITENDAPGGFSVYNPEELTETCPLSSDCSITVLDWVDNYTSTEITAEEFRQLIEDRGDQNTWIPYTITVENGEITKIEEHYVP